MDRGGEWTEVASGQRWRVDIGGEWTEVASRQRWRVNRGGEWTVSMPAVYAHNYYLLLNIEAFYQAIFTIVHFYKVLSKFSQRKYLPHVHLRQRKLTKFEEKVSVVHIRQRSA